MVSNQILVDRLLKISHLIFTHYKEIQYIITKLFGQLLLQQLTVFQLRADINYTDYHKRLKVILQLNYNV